MSSDATPPNDNNQSAHVLLVEDTVELSKAMARTLERAGLQVVIASHFAEAMRMVTQPGVRFDAAVLDHQLPDGDSREVVSALGSREPSCSALILTAHQDHDLALEYRGRGAFRFAIKPLTGIQLLANVHATMLDTHRWRSAGNSGVSLPKEPPVVIVDVEQAADRLRYIAKLSPTEREVAYWVLQGLRDAQIAELLGRAERTAKRHVGQVLAKAGVQNRASLWALLRTDGVAQIKAQGDEDSEDSGGHPLVGSWPLSDESASAAAP